jgi:hypothetical protein
MRSAVSPPIQPSKRSRGFRSGSKKLSFAQDARRTSQP